MKTIDLKTLLPIFIFVLLLNLVLALRLAYQDRISPGVAVTGMPLGNKTKNEAHNILLSKINLLTPQKLVLVNGNKTWEEDLKNLGFSYNLEVTLDSAYQIGRGGNPLVAWQEKNTALFKGVNLPLFYQINQAALEERINQISQSLFAPTVNPQIKVLTKNVTIEPGKAGQEVDRRSLMATIGQQLAFLKNESIVIPINQINPQLTETEMTTAKARAEKLLNKSLKLTVEDQSFTISETQLINFISLEGGFDLEKINNYTKDLSSTLNRPAQNAAFQFSAGRAVVFKPAKDGIHLLEQQTTQQILTALQSLEEFTPGEKKEITLALEIEKSPPQIQTGEVNDLGIKQLLGKGVSHFKGSIPSRIHNIVLASSRLNGILVAPGETFSFNQALGEVSQATGFKEAYIIQSGRTILGDGGGVCQVSTTLFRAVLNAGLPVEERHAHAYRVAYYEQGSPVGLDATVFAPGIDFKFKNDTPAHLLIQTLVDAKSQTLNFELYGSSDGRMTTVNKPRVWDQAPPPPDLYQDDPTLPTGTTKQIDFRAWGAKVAFDWKVTRGAETLQERTFYSVYRPWQAIFLKGTGPSQ